MSAVHSCELLEQSRALLRCVLLAPADTQGGQQAAGTGCARGQRSRAGHGELLCILLCRRVDEDRALRPLRALAVSASTAVGRS